MIENLRPVLQLEGQPPLAISKTLLFPRSLVPIVARLGEQEESPHQVLDLHYRRNLETLPCITDRVRAELVEESYEILLESHPLYRDLHRPTVMTSVRESMEDMVTMGLVTEEDPPTTQRVHSILMPDWWNLIPHQTQILEVQALDSKLAPIFDPRGEAGVDQEDRLLPITLQDWCEQRLANVRRDGPMDQADVVLALGLQHTTRYLHDARNVGEVGLVSRPGTSSYYRGLHYNLTTMRQWLGPPHFFISASFDPTSKLMLSTWVSHTAGVEGKQEKVWHVGSERQLLALRPGREQENMEREETFYVHCRSEVEDDSCPYHNFCCRQPVEEWRVR